MRSEIKNILSPLSKPERIQLILLSIADFIINIADLLFIAALFFLISKWDKPDAIPFLSAQMKDPVILLLLCFFLFSIKNFCAYFLMKKQFSFVYEIATGISNKRIRDYLDEDYKTHISSHSSRSIRFISQEPIEYSHYVLRSFQIIISNLSMVIFTTAAIFILIPGIFSLVALIFLPPVILLSWVLKKKLSRAKMNAKIFGETSLQHLQEAINGYVEANINQKKDFFITRYRKAQQALNQNLSYQLLAQVIPGRILETCIIGGILIYIFFSNDQPDFFSLGAFVAAGYKVIPGISKIMNSIGMIRSYSYTFDNPAPLSIQSFKTELRLAEINSIEFSEVSYSYGDRVILSDFNLIIIKGEFTRLGGLSGKGKTTLINLLLGFLEPDSGSIRFNGKVLNAEQRRNYWPVISYIKQDSFFIHDSIKMNICLNNNIDEQKLNSLISLTGLDKCLSKLVGGENTVLYENGRNLSGGEKQRVILARALYKDADLIILDEPFNELDEFAVIEMNEILYSIAAKGKMVCMISHLNIEAPYSHTRILE